MAVGGRRLLPLRRQLPDSLLPSLAGLPALPVSGRARPQIRGLGRAGSLGDLGWVVDALTVVSVIPPAKPHASPRCLRILVLPVAAALLVSGLPCRRARADDNPQSPGCPFPAGDGHSRTDPPGSERQSSGRSEQPDDIDTSDVGSTDFLSCSGSNEWGAWTEFVGARLDASFGATDMGDLAFSDDGEVLTLDGETLALGTAHLAGGEFAIDVAPTSALRLGAGGGLYGPVGGVDGGEVQPSALGHGAFSQHLTVYVAFVEAGFAQRIGSIFTFAMVRAGLLHASIDVDSDCGCAGTLRADDFVLGPRLGLRAPLYASLYAQAAVFADATRPFDYTATLGIGIGRRPR